MAKTDLTAQRLRELLHYNQDTGVFVWANKTSNKVRIGDVAGSYAPSRKYITIGISGTNYFAHRLAALYVLGSWPTGVVDHIDGNKRNNAFSNLRCVSVQINTQNQRSPAKNNKTGFLGVSYHPKRQEFRAVITVNRKQVWIGAYKAPELAHAAYLAAKRLHHAGCMI